MSKQISFSRIATDKIAFETLYYTSIHSTDIANVTSSLEKMAALQEKIVQTISRPSLNNFLNLSLRNPGALTQPVVTVDADTTSDQLQIKLSNLRGHLETLLSHTDVPPPSLEGRAETISTTSPPNTSGTRVAEDLAVGFCNAASNCWANSLLSMIVCLPNLKQAYLEVAQYYAGKDLSDPSKIHGMALASAIVEYDLALGNKTAVPSEVTQNVRLAFNHLFGYIDPITGAEIFSPDPWANEDAYEALQVLMGRYEQIKREKNAHDPELVPLYGQMQTTRQYVPIGAQRDADPLKVQRDSYSRLAADNTSRSTCNDYQILLDLQNKGHLSFSSLLCDCFCNTLVEGSNTAEYLLPSGKVQNFQLTGEGRKYLTTPEEFMLTSKRFGSDPTGHSYKITDPVMIHRVLVLPPEATSQNTPAVYKLDAFIIHSGGIAGGHYICYKEIGGEWIEVNDGSVRFVTPVEIDQILHGQKGSDFTSYMHHYARVPDSSEAIALASMQNIAIPGPQALVLALADIEKYTAQKAEYENSLLALENPTSSLQDLENLPTKTLNTLLHAIWLNDKTPNVTDYGMLALKKHPECLQEITLPWLIAPKGVSLLQQMVRMQEIKLSIVEEKLKNAQVKAFLALLNDPGIPNADLILALMALPETIQGTLHGLIYKVHKIQFGEAYVHRSEYNNQYGRVALENALDLRTVLKNAQESVLNPFGGNIIEQLVFDTQRRAEKMQYQFEKIQLMAFRQLLLHYPPQAMTNQQLAQAFERFELRDELRQILRYAIWAGHGRKSIPNYGGMKLKEDPRCILHIKAPIIANLGDCNILDQLIHLLDRQSR